MATRTPATLAAQGIPGVTLDWDDLDTYLPALRGKDRLFLLTPNSERQVGYVLQAVAAARRAGIKHIVRLSLMGADADPGTILGHQHLAAEREIRASGMAWTTLRPSFSWITSSTATASIRAGTARSSCPTARARRPGSIRPTSARWRPGC